MIRTAEMRMLFLFAVGQLLFTAGAQNATLDPVEARALNNMFQSWRISATNDWNISGELCSGVAIDATVLGDINPGIKCDCSFVNNSVCHITALRVYEMDVYGPIPDELWTLTYTNDLDLRRNYLIGPISSSIGNLTRMQYLSFGTNALSGVLPKAIGLLTNLRTLALGINSFSGPLPSELGNLLRLEEIFINSGVFSGPIPATFANLRNLKTLWAVGNEFTGQIPYFIGNLSNLIELRFQGNSFEGPIPPSFSNLTSLNDLRISDVFNGSSSMDFLRDMKSLSTLVLRNNNMSGSLPLFLGELQSLKLLDLSFNNFTGRIPNLIFNLTSLTTLNQLYMVIYSPYNAFTILRFLGNNKLTGALPPLKTLSLQNIDLSYNELSGSIPSWVSTQNLQLNLVSNNFTLSEGSINSALPSGLDCLQRNFPCNRGRPLYSSFAVNCGGQQIRSSDQIVYEMDNETLGPATYYVSNTRRWGVSSSGLYVSNMKSQYISTSSSQFTNTMDLELFQTSRISAGSLRYFGLGLENGNYAVNLQFAESEIVGLNARRSLGRRVFDIYVQGNLEIKDFDIRREAGGLSLRAVVRSFNVQVSENFIDIHLFWAGKGTCCVPRLAAYGPSISAIGVTPNFVPTVANEPPSEKKNRTGLIVGVVVPVAAASFIFLFVVYYVLERRGKQKSLEDDELVGIDARPYIFSYSELRAATNDFSPDNKLGEGGFGPVYKGELGDGRAVAVKQLSVKSHQGKRQFLAEIATISAVQHRNLVKLYGCCIEGEKRLLVYEYLHNKSLDQLLFGIGTKSLYLDWGTRYNICLGIARGLAYLHEESQPRIVHRDVKASNILLDSDFSPKISDFGLAKLYDDKMTHISTQVAGTYGYLSPEYAMRGHLSEKVDVFSFGVVALEIISGRTNRDSTLLEWAWNLHESNHEIELVDQSLHEYEANEVRRTIAVSLVCTQASPGLRPAMSRVVAMLSGDVEVAKVTARPGYLIDWMFNDDTTTSVTNSDAGNFKFVSTTSTTDAERSPDCIDPAKSILNEIIDGDKC